jgi:hypothetical protein
MKNRVFLFCPMLLPLPAICAAHCGKGVILSATASTLHPGYWFSPVASNLKRITSAIIPEPGLPYGTARDWSRGFYAGIDHGSSPTQEIAL